MKLAIQSEALSMIRHMIPEDSLSLLGSLAAMVLMFLAAVMV